MNSISSSIINQQNTQVTRNTAIRNAAKDTDLPKLTKDESQLIQKKFNNPKPLNMYSMNGEKQQSEFHRGRNIDTRA